MPSVSIDCGCGKTLELSLVTETRMFFCECGALYQVTMRQLDRSADEVSGLDPS